MQRNIRAQTNSSTEDGQMNAKQPRTRTKWTVDMNTALINLACSKMAAAHVLTKSVLNFVIFLVYLLCSSDLYTLNDINGNVRYTTRKLIATSSFNRSRILFYNNSCSSFNLPRLKLVGLIHPNPGPTRETVTNVNSYQKGKPQLNINCLYMNARTIVNKIDELQCARYKHGRVGYHRDMANTGHQQLRDLA